MDHVYWNLLLAYPLISLALQDGLGMLLFQSRRRRRAAQSPLHKGLNLMLLWAGFAFIAEPMSSAQGLHTSLRETCRSNLGLPPLMLQEEQ